MRFARDFSLAFSAGGVGALVNSVVAWSFGSLGVTAALGVKMAPALTRTWLYPRIVWGGLWGLMLLLPVIKRSHAQRGVLLSIVPTLITLFVLYPEEGKGVMGAQLGALTPLFPLILNAVWGAVAGAWYAMVSERRGGLGVR
ncbi:MAG: hypothetical protein HY788_14015 [Deltaproteobacteria bacterium]|nr:hypothetical protein [Deltaproteobacteria bacterium]